MPIELKTPTWRDRKKLLFGLVAVCYLDIVASIVQWRLLEEYLDIHAGLPAVWRGFSDLIRFSTDFAGSTGDVVFLSLMRVILVPVLLYVAVQTGHPDKAIERLVKEKSMQHRKPPPSLNSVDVDDELVGSPLLSTNSMLNNAPHVTETDKKNAKLKAITSMNVGVIFVIETLCQVHIGIKTVLFDFEGNYEIPAVCLVSLIVWMNAELFLARFLAEDLTKDVGKFFPHLHQHVLHFTSDDSTGHICDLCHRQRIREAYRCDQCDFDLCMNCVRKKSKKGGEGLIRGDAGVREEKEISNWEYLKRGLKFARPHLFLVILAIVMMIASSVATLILPNFQGKILDNVIKADSDAFVLDIKYYIGFTAAVALFSSIRKVCFGLVGRKMAVSIRNHLFASVIVQDIAFFDGMSTGELTSRLRSDVYGMVSPVQSLLSTFLSSILYLVGGLIMCLYTSWRLSVLAFTTIGPIVLIYRVYSKWSRNINRQIWAAWGDASNIATQSISNIRTVRAFGMEKLEMAKYEKSNDEALTKGIKDAYASAGTVTLTNYIDLGISVLLLWYGGTVAMDHSSRLSVGSLITFQLYWGMIDNAYNGLSDLITQFTRAGGAAQRVMRLLDSLPDIDPTAGIRIPSIQGDIELENVHFTYQMRPDHEVLKGINLSIKKGEVLALVGRSGGGKSTLVHLMLRFYNPTKGTISIDGYDLRDLSPLSFRKRIGIVAQDTQLFNATILENIAYGTEDYTPEDVIAAAKKAHAHNFIMKMDDGYETRVGERGVRLSGGQRQRLAIARAFLRKPTILFLDEATSALDAESEGLVQMAIDNLIATSRCTVVLVAHRLSTVMNADKIAVIDDGRIVELGNHAALMKQDGFYAALVQRQIAKENNTLTEEAALLEED